MVDHSRIGPIEHRLQSLADAVLLQVERSFTALRTLDQTLAAVVEANDSDINHMAQQLEQQCLLHMVIPATAEEISWLTGALRLGATLERAGDKVRNLSRRVVEGLSDADLLQSSGLMRYANAVENALEGVLVSFASGSTPRRIQCAARHERIFAETALMTWVQGQRGESPDAGKEIVAVLSLERTLRRAAQLAIEISHQVEIQRQFDPSGSWLREPWRALGAVA